MYRKLGSRIPLALSLTWLYCQIMDIDLDLQKSAHPTSHPNKHLLETYYMPGTIGKYKDKGYRL